MKIHIKKILVVGQGSMGAKYVKVLEESCPELTIAVLRRTTSERRTLGRVKDYFTTMSECLEYCPDVAIVASPATTHIEIAIPLARAGIHLLIEKPLSSDTTGVRTLIDLCWNQNVKLMVGYGLRFSPSLRAFREHLKQASIGKQYLVRAEVGQYLPNWRPNADYTKTVSARKDSGGGVLLELSHEIDYMLWLFGNMAWVSAHLSKQSDLDVDVEDSAHLIVGFDRHADSQRHLVASLNMDFLRRDFKRECTVIGEHGTLRWDWSTGVVERFLAGIGKWETLYSQKEDALSLDGEKVEHFLACVRNDVHPDVGGQVGKNVMDVVIAARLSANVGKRVNVESA